MRVGSFAPVLSSVAVVTMTGVTHTSGMVEAREPVQAPGSSDATGRTSRSRLGVLIGAWVLFGLSVGFCLPASSLVQMASDACSTTACSNTVDRWTIAAIAAQVVIAVATTIAAIVQKAFARRLIILAVGFFAAPVVLIAMLELAGSAVDKHLL